MNDQKVPVPADPTKSHLHAALKHERPLISCRFAPDGNAVYFGAQDNQLWRWQLEGNQKTAFAGHDSWVRTIGFLEAGQQVLSGGYDGRLIWWDTKAKKTRVVEAHQGWMRALAVSPDQELIATAGNDRTVRVWQANDGKLVQQLEGHAAHVYNVGFHPDGKRLVSGDLKAEMIAWNLADGKPQQRVTLAALTKYDNTFKADIGGPRGMTFSRDGKRLAVSGITNVSNAFAGVGNPIVEVLDAENLKSLQKHGSKAKLRGVAWRVAIHQQDFTIAVSGGGGGGFLLFWKPGEEHEFHQFKLPNTARDMDLSPDGLHLVTAHYDGHARIVRMLPKAA